MREYRGEFEVHITVGLPDRGGRDRFLDWCRIHDFKFVHIILDRGDHIDQPMATWRRSQASLTTVLAEARVIATELQKIAFSVIRVKVEVDTLNQDVPQFDEEAIGHAASNYFEHHVKLLRDRPAPCDRLLRVCVEQQAHLSRNSWREPSQGKEERFVTSRYYRVGSASSRSQLQQLLECLNELGEQVIDVESEYCVYDTNLDLDRGWLGLEMLDCSG
jgi:hypothetical protein